MGARRREDGMRVHRIPQCHYYDNLHLVYISSNSCACVLCPPHFTAAQARWVLGDGIVMGPEFRVVRWGAERAAAATEEGTDRVRCTVEVSYDDVVVSDHFLRAMCVWRRCPFFPLFS